MSMDLKGKLIQVQPPQTGMGKKGPWKKQEYILETQSQYPKKVCFSLWGDKIDQFGLGVGDELTVSLDLESREYNGRWYTEARAWKVEKSAGGQQATRDPIGDEPFVSGNAAPASPDDLPF